MDASLTDGSSALKASEGGAGTAPRLVSLAILKANWNVGRSYLDNFVPFVAECIRATPGPVTAGQLKIAMRERFGIRIPEKALETVMSRAAKQGLVSRRRGEYHPDTDKLARVIAPVQGDFLRCHAAIVSGLCDFARGRYNREVTQQEAASTLESYVAEYGTPIVVQGAAADRDFDPKVVASPDVAYILHAYVEHLAAADPAGFGYLATVVEGSMLASVVYLPDVGRVQQKFTSTTVYLDTPFLLRVLGHAGAELASPALELLDLLRQLGASVACFEKTISETRGVLLNAGRSLHCKAPHGANDIVIHFRQRGLQRADIEIYAGRLEKDLSSSGIRIIAAPPYTAVTDIDETELVRVLQEEVRYAHEQTLRHDLDALTAIDRLRRGRYQPILENCHALFLTTNTRLVRAAKRYFASNDQGFSWPPAMSDTELTTLVWLKQPLKAPDLPRKQIMADCYAVLHPDQATWDRWMAEIARAEANGDYSDEDLDYIRFSPDAQRTLMDVTFGDSGSLNSKTLAEVLEKAKAAITKPVIERLANAQEQLDAERRLRALAEASARDEAERAERAVLAKAAAEAALEGDRASRRAALDMVASRKARTIGNVTFVSLLIVFTVGLVLSLAGVAPIPGPSVPGAIRACGLVVFVVSGAAGVASNGFGFNAGHLRKRVEKRARQRLLARYVRRAGLEA